MQHYLALFTALIIFSYTGVMDAFLSRAGLTRFEFAFPFVAGVALSGFSIDPWAGFTVDMAALALPAVFLALSRSKRDDGGKVAALAAASLLPLGAAAVVTLYDLIFFSYAAFELTAGTACLAQIALVALASLAIAIKKKPARE